MTTTQTEHIMALADRYAFHIPGSQHSDEARAALLAALQARDQMEPSIYIAFTKTNENIRFWKVINTVECKLTAEDLA